MMRAGAMFIWPICGTSFVVVNTMLIVPTQPVPNQNFQVVLNGQQMTFNLSQTAFGLFMDVLLSGVAIITGQICLNQEPLVQQVYTGFSGELIFVDVQGTSDPVYTGLGSRFVLVYLEPADLAAAA